MWVTCSAVASSLLLSHLPSLVHCVCMQTAKQIFQFSLILGYGCQGFDECCAHIIDLNLPLVELQVGCVVNHKPLSTIKLLTS